MARDPIYMTEKAQPARRVSWSPFRNLVLFNILGTAEGGMILLFGERLIREAESSGKRCDQNYDPEARTDGASPRNESQLGVVQTHKPRFEMHPRGGSHPFDSAHLD